MANKCFCKYCGQSFISVSAMTNYSCKKSPSKRHELYEGGEKSQYICKHCGQKFQSLVSMANASCRKSPTTRHEPAL